MTTSSAELREPLAVVASAVREVRRDVKRLRRDTAWLIQAVQALLDHDGTVVSASPRDDSEPQS
jgi:hypothetical protein